MLQFQEIQAGQQFLKWETKNEQKPKKPRQNRSSQKSNNYSMKSEERNEGPESN